MSRGGGSAGIQIPRHFDKEAAQLIREAEALGWSGKVTRRAHVILRAPDGETQIVVSRDSLRGRSGRNQQAELRRWVREQEKNQG